MLLLSSLGVVHSTEYCDGSYTGSRNHSLLQGEIIPKLPHRNTSQIPVDGTGCAHAAASLLVTSHLGARRYHNG